MTQQHSLGKVATTIKRDDDGTLRVRYHSTDVVTLYNDGRLVLDHGGWMTSTTKVRMNQAANQLGLGYQVYQKDFAWFIDIDGKEIPFNSSPITVRTLFLPNLAS